jgi:hypothetical protein
MKRRFTTNSRLVHELFANYISTFTAFCELINNSLQAGAQNIWIDIDYTKEEEVYPLVIKKISIKDDGCGVHVSEVPNKLLDIGTANKDGGKGIGRFAAFQLGRTIKIETIGYSTLEKTFSKVTIPLRFEMFGKNLNVTEVDLDTQEVILKGLNHDTFYKVSISELYDSTVTDSEPKKKIIDKFLKTNIKDAIFERYPLKIFNKEINVFINNSKIDPSDFLVESPITKVVDYEDKKGKSHKVLFDYMNIKKMPKIKVFLTTKNAGIQTIATGFEFEANWLSPKIGGWFIYIQSNSLPSDMYRNIDLDGMDENIKHYKEFLKQQLNDFFKERNKEFDNFMDKLKKDEYYPYKEKSSSQSKILLFDKVAYIVEDRFQILKEDNKIREIIYPLIDRSISNGEFENVLRNMLKLNNKMVTKFSELLERSDMEDIIEFSDKVAKKTEELEFLEKLVYSDISKNVKERKQLHKFLEKMLWVFGEEYNESTHLMSDKGLEGNLLELRDKTLVYKASKNDDNIADIKETNIKSITDLFLYSERILDMNVREVLIVELKAPKVKISPKELGQVMKYAQEIEEMGVFPDRLHYKVLLISSEISKQAKYDIEGRQKVVDNPYLYHKNANGNIEVWVMKWSDLLENLKRKLKYMSNILSTKDVNVQEKAKRDFEEIDFSKVSSTLKKVAV